jgi:hypothetical protein
MDIRWIVKLLCVRSIRNKGLIDVGSGRVPLNIQAPIPRPVVILHQGDEHGLDCDARRGCHRLLRRSPQPRGCPTSREPGKPRLARQTSPPIDCESLFSPEVKVSSPPSSRGRFYPEFSFLTSRMAPSVHPSRPFAMCEKIFIWSAPNSLRSAPAPPKIARYSATLATPRLPPTCCRPDAVRGA